MRWIQRAMAALLLSQLAACATTTPVIQAERELVDLQREAYKKAYNAGDTVAGVQALCETLDENVSFRGRFMPGVWTGPRNELIKRWTRGTRVDCSGTPGQRVGVRIIGSNTLSLSPTDIRKLGDKSYLEEGTFKMIPLGVEGQQWKVEDGRYVMIWVKAPSGKWTLKHIDMDP